MRDRVVAVLGNLDRLNVAVLGQGPRALASAICMSRHHRVRLGEMGASRLHGRFAGRPIYPDEFGLHMLMQRVARDIKFTDSYAAALDAAELVIVAEPPSFLAEIRCFDMSSVERCLAAVARHRPRATVVLEVATPVGFALRASERYRLQVIPAPFRLRKGFVAQDRVLPHRVVVGDAAERGLAYAFQAIRSCGDLNTPYLLTNASEAEAIHAFEHKRSTTGLIEPHEKIVAYCRQRRLNEEHVLRGLDSLQVVYDSLTDAASP